VVQFLTSLAEERLLTFDRRKRAWTWDLDGIAGKGSTENLLDLMIGRLRRLPDATQEALKLLACLGTQADFSTLAIVHGGSEDGARSTSDVIAANARMHGSFRAAVEAGTIISQEGKYRFLHDRAQEAAYALIPAQSRADLHLRTGRRLASGTAPEKIAERIFDIVNQLNQGLRLISARVERQRVAELNLQAGRKAKASSAYASACHYLAAGMDVLAEGAWEDCYDLTLELYLERAECEILSSKLDLAAALIEELLRKGRSKTDRAEACRLRMLLELKRGDYAPAVRTALECLRMFNLDLPERPTPEQVRAEYDEVRQTLGDRSIASLVDLPLMADPEMRAVMKLFNALGEVAYHSDSRLFQMIACCMVKLTLRHGTTEFSTIAYASLGIVLGPVFRLFRDGEEFGRLAVAVSERHRFIAPKAGAHFLMQMAVLWTRPIGQALICLEAAARSARETGEMVYACYTRQHRLTDLMARGDPLDEVWRESVAALDFVRKYKFGQVVVLSTQEFVEGLRGQARGANHVDGAALEARVLRNGVAVVACFHWILQLQRHFLLGDPDTALAFAAKAKPLLWSARLNIQSVDYCLYHSLALTAVIPAASPERQAELREALTENLHSLERWAASCPETFSHKHTLVAAEAARLEGREFEAMRLYEQTIRSAAANGFIHDEAIAYEIAARFYAAHGFDRIAEVHLLQARSGYVRWGADAKVRQLDQQYPRIQPERLLASSTSMIALPVENLDLATVIKVSQSVSGELVLEKLIDRLMRAAIELAGAQRGLLINPRNDKLLIEAEATIHGGNLTVNLGGGANTARALAQSLTKHVARTQETVILDDALSKNPFSADPYISERRTRSVLCLPLITRGKLIGILYLENNLTPNVFNAGRVTVLKVLASQAAISLENTRLYRGLEEREAKIRRLVDSNILGIFFWNFDGRILDANDAFLRMVQYDREDLTEGRMRWTEMTPPEWRERNNLRIETHRSSGHFPPFEKEYTRKDGSRVPVLMGETTFEEGGDEGVAFVLDLTERKRAEERLRVQHTVAQVLAEAVTIDEAAPRILRAMGECLGWDVGALWRVDLKVEALRCVELWHKASIQVPEFERVSRESTFALGLGLPGRVWSSLQPAYVHDVVSDENFPRGPIAKQEGLHAAFGFPIVLGREALGVIEFFSREIRQPDQELLNLLATIGSQIGQFIERKRAEMALRDSEEGVRRREKELRDILDTIPAMTVTVLPDGTDVFIGKRFVEYSGLSGDKARRSGWKATAHPADVDEHVSKWRSSLVSGEPIEIETRFRRADGEYRWFLARAAPLRDDQGNILNWYEVLTDIEDRKRAEMALRHSEEALRRSEAYLAEAQHLSHTGSVACNETSNVHWSDETFRILGFDRLDGLPSPEAVLQRVHPDDRERFNDVTTRGAREKADYKVEFRIIFPGGTIKYIELAGHPKYSADGEFLEVVGTIIDVTERKRAQDEHERLGQLETDLAHMNRLGMMGELSASLAHEIKQPIAAARNNAGILSPSRVERFDLNEASLRSNRHYGGCSFCCGGSCSIATSPPEPDSKRG
jgi:PAS domain S-box-containing protein